MSNLIFCTGANGYLGGHVVKELERRGYEVYGLDSHWRQVSNRPAMGWGGWLTEAKAVIHLAWYSSAGDGQPDLQRYSLDMTRQLVDHCREDQQFLFASTASVYGDTGDKEVTEEAGVAPNCAYTNSKAIAEGFIREQLPRALIFRLGSLMGLGITRTKVELVVNAFAVGGWQRKKIECWNPESWKPVLHVRKAAELLVEAMEGNWKGVYNAAYGNLQAKEIAALAAMVTGGEVVEIPSPGGNRSCYINCDKLRQLRGLGKDLGKSVTETVQELQYYRPQVNDKNIPWNHYEDMARKYRNS